MGFMGSIDLVAQMADMDPQVFPFVRVLGFPDLVEEHFTGKYFIGVERQRAQEGVFNGCEVLNSIPTLHHPRRIIDLQLWEPRYLGCLR